MNEKEFTKIVNSTKKVVLNAIRKHLQPEYYESIDDVAQEVYMRAFNSLSQGKFRKESEISTWLHTIARNESIRMNDKQNREIEKTEAMKPDVKEEYTMDLESEDSNEKSYLKELLNALPEKYKKVMELDVLGYKDKQIAQMLQISAGTVKSRNSRARDLLRKMAANKNTEKYQEL